MKSNQESKTKTVLFYDDIKDKVDSDCEMNKGFSGIFNLSY